MHKHSGNNGSQQGSEFHVLSSQSRANWDLMAPPPPPRVNGSALVKHLPLHLSGLEGSSGLAPVRTGERELFLGGMSWVFQVFQSGFYPLVSIP